jgi:predicted enzyme related to lactoylglutathione lyase
MPHVESHTPCTINWVDFVSTDLDAASAFYTGLFGWETYDMPMPGGDGIYRFFRLDGRDAAGGQVLMAPTTLGPSGRLAMIADPGGAAVGVWQADQHIGAGVVEEPGAMTWWEVNTRAFEDCKRFYGQVFGWSAEPLDAPGVNYVTWKLDGKTVGGMLEMTPEWEGIPSAWMTYFAVTDTDAAAQRAGELGGSVGAPPFDTDFGRIAVLVDPAGGHFSVVTPTQPPAG